MCPWSDEVGLSMRSVPPLLAPALGLSSRIWSRVHGATLRCVAVLMLAPGFK